MDVLSFSQFLFNGSPGLCFCWTDQIFLLKFCQDSFAHLGDNFANDSPVNPPMVVHRSVAFSSGQVPACNQTNFQWLPEIFILECSVASSLLSLKYPGHNPWILWLPRSLGWGMWWWCWLWRCWVPLSSSSGNHDEK